MLGHQMAFRWRADDDGLLLWGIEIKKKKRCLTQNFQSPRLLRERERGGGGGELMVPVKLFHQYFLLSTLYEQLGVCTLLVTHSVS